MILSQGVVISQIPGIAPSRVAAQLAPRFGSLEETAMYSALGGFLSVRRPTPTGFGSSESGALRDDGSRAVAAEAFGHSDEMLSHPSLDIAAFPIDAPDRSISMMFSRSIRFSSTPNQAPEPTTAAVTPRAI